MTTTLRTILALAATVLVAAPASASALTITRPDGTPYATPHPIARSVDRMRAQTPPITLRLHRGECPSFPGEGRACATWSLADGAPEVYMPDGTLRPNDPSVLYHEIGHHLSHLARPDVRARMGRLMGRVGVAWLDTTRGHSSEERFADLYANCAQFAAPQITYRSPRGRWMVTVIGMYSFDMGLGEYRRACTALRIEPIF